MGSDEAYTRNFLERIGNSINEGTREAFPIYMTEQAQHGSLLDRIGGGGYWASMVPSILGSAASIMLPARGASLLLGKAFRGAVNLGSKSKYVKDVFGIANEMQKAKALSGASKIADVYGSAVISRVLDSSRELMVLMNKNVNGFLIIIRTMLNVMKMVMLFLKLRD